MLVLIYQSIVRKKIHLNHSFCFASAQQKVPSGRWTNFVSSLSDQAARYPTELSWFTNPLLNARKNIRSSFTMMVSWCTNVAKNMFVREVCSLDLIVQVHCLSEWIIPQWSVSSNFSKDEADFEDFKYIDLNSQIISEGTTKMIRT